MIFLKKFEQAKIMNILNIDLILNKVARYNFHNGSQFSFDKLIADPNNNSCKSEGLY